MKGKLLSILIFVLGVSLCEGQSWVWAEEGTSISDTYGIGTDKIGDAYITGYFNNAIQFGSVTLSSPTALNFYVVKYDSLGHVLWARQSMPHTSDPDPNVQGIEVATDDSLNVYCVGGFRDSALFGTKEIKTTASWDSFIVKYDKNGNVIWVWQSYSIGAALNGIQSIQVNKSGDILVAGVTIGGASVLSGDTVNITPGGTYIAKFDQSGTLLWVRPSTHSTALPYLQNVIVDKKGYSYIVGCFNDSLVFNSYSLYSSSGISDIFFVKYDSSGNVIWAKQSLSSKTNKGGGECYSATIDNSENIYLTGQFYDTISIGNDTFKGLNSNIYLVKLDSNGNTIWGKQSIGNYSYLEGTSLAIDNNDIIYFSGGEEGSVMTLCYFWMILFW